MKKFIIGCAALALVGCSSKTTPVDKIEEIDSIVIETGEEVDSIIETNVETVDSIIVQ